MMIRERFQIRHRSLQSGWKASSVIVRYFAGGSFFACRTVSRSWNLEEWAGIQPVDR
jgi:hypothetical protein